MAFFTDSFHEANGIARLSRAFATYARRRDLPWLCVHGSDRTAVDPPRTQRYVALRRGAATFRIEHDLGFDPLFWRHVRTVRDVLREFQPDVLHLTGPSDVGQLGAYLGHRLHVPILGSWHTNVHEYAALRSQRWYRWLPEAGRKLVRRGVERSTLGPRWRSTPFRVCCWHPTKISSACSARAPEDRRT